MRTFPKATIESADGFQMITAQMDEMLQETTEKMYRPSFERREIMKRKKGQTTEQYTLKYHLSFQEAQNLESISRMLWARF